MNMFYFIQKVLSFLNLGYKYENILYRIHNYALMIMGLLLSVLLVVTLASYFANYIKDHKWLGYVGIFVIIIVALQLIIGGLVNLEILTIKEQYEFLFSI